MRVVSCKTRITGAVTCFSYNRRASDHQSLTISSDTTQTQRDSWDDYYLMGLVNTFGVVNVVVSLGHQRPERLVSTDKVQWGVHWPKPIVGSTLPLHQFEAFTHSIFPTSNSCCLHLINL